MTEAEWLVCTDLFRMQEHVRSQVTPRKLRLFACACCRRCWHKLPRRSKRAVEMAEKYADGLASAEELAQAYRRAERTYDAIVDATGSPSWRPQVAGPYAAMLAAAEDLGTECWREFSQAAEYAINYPAYWAGEFGRLTHCDLLREVFGNPFRSMVVDPSWRSWRGGDLTEISQAIYEDRRFGDMPLLAEVLQAAGCCDDAVLNHCRSQGQHARGCWVLDAILERT